MKFANLVIGASALALAACAVGPDYTPKTVTPSAAAPFMGAEQTALVTTGAPAGDWWRLYDDAVLDALVRDALAANTDIRVAVARLARARALVREERGAREPQLGVGAGAQYGRSSSSLASGDTDSDLQVSGGLDVAYDVDLVGRISRRIEAAGGDAEAAAADADAVRVAIVADTVAAYADAVSAAEQVGVAEQIAALLDRSYQLTEKRHQLGLANGLDTARIATLRDQRRAAIPLLQAQRQRALLRLATLTGHPPRDLPAQATDRLSALRMEQAIPVGDGAGLLARRPDVRAAERRLAAATARIGVATADLYPRITLGGSVAAGGSGLGNLFSNPIGFLIGPLINWTANRSAARARIAGAEADQQAALATFDGTVLGALEETEAALAAYREAINRRDALRAANTQAERAATITRAREREGDISSLELLDAERTAADTKAALAEADAAIATAQIALFRALGGGWSQT
ncbi:efflux transporter outer membrane subunit [Sphingomonas sabuli]|uniref:Efflux transporter outer membrane subunit n=1 Tax=Sphingomonas sabuli TaxID=2764186 RepID=A0A7G9L1D4_9SPHN|nr:efflux transporter outer membrane subunit [Sphingomonas sabuli]QNM82433.1 efflux transporter outer membrane subunit [Sphingomonas sabuli]